MSERFVVTRQAVVTTFRSLSVRNYRLYFFGQAVSVSGSWMQRVAQAWLVLHLTGSGAALGATLALQSLPMFLLGVWGGLIADRVDKRRLLLVTQSVASLQAVTLGLLTLTGTVQLWMVLLLALALGCLTAVDNPARQAFASEMVGPELVANAVGLNSAIFTSARVVGPAVGGLLIAAVGTGWCFEINAASYLAVLAALARMDPGQFHRGLPVARQPGQIREGLRYAWSSPTIRVPLLLMAVAGTFVYNFQVLMPLLARFTFHGDARTYGFLFSSLGVGSVTGALIAAGRAQPARRQLLGALLGLGLFMLGAAAVPVLWLEMLVLVPLGASAIVFQATGNATLQLAADQRMRGRVMSLFAVVFVGSTAIGAPMVGWVAQLWGARAAFVLGGVAALAAFLAGVVWLRSGGEALQAGDPTSSRERLYRQRKS